MRALVRASALAALLTAALLALQEHAAAEGGEAPRPEQAVAAPAKEPEYASTPRYARFVFGEDETRTVWCVYVDGVEDDGGETEATLYWDADGDGDLTDPEERLGASQRSATWTRFRLPDVRLGQSGPAHTSIRLTVDAENHVLSLALRYRDEVPAWLSAGLGRERARLALEPAQAPVVRIGGRIIPTLLWVHPALEAGRRSTLCGAVGFDPGGDDRPIVTLSYRAIPEGCDPVVYVRLARTGGHLAAACHLTERC